MIAEEVIDNHPLRLLDEETGVPEADLSVVLARSGVGKTSVLINFALDTLLQGKKVLHFCAGMDSEKVHDYYQEIFQELSKEIPEFRGVAWAELNQRLMVISYREAGHMIQELDKELTTLEENAHIEPSLLIVDGLDGDDASSEHLNILKTNAKKHGYKTLASMTIHRNHDGSINLDDPLDLVKSYSTHVYYLEPTQNRIKVDFMTDKGILQLPIYFCPHDLVFKKTS